MRQGARVWILLLLATARAMAFADTAGRPDIRARLKPTVLEKVLRDQEVATSARLDTDELSVGGGARVSKSFTSQMPPIERYEFHTVMRVGATLERTRRVVMDPRVY